MKKAVSALLSVCLLPSLIACSNHSTISTDTVPSSSIANAKESKIILHDQRKLSQWFKTAKKDGPTGRRIKALENIAMYYNWHHDSNIKEAKEELFGNTPLHDNLDVVEAAFREASVMDPYDSDLKYSLASTQIFHHEVPEALKTYQQILKLDHDNFKARLAYALYSKAEGHEQDFKTNFNQLEKINKTRANDYKNRLKDVERIKAMKINGQIPNHLPDNGSHAFILLGAGLSDQGKIQKPLLGRLEVAKKAAEKYPRSKIIVTGGSPKEGKTEAAAMYDWLVKSGINKDRIIKEDMAMDTVENALFSMDIAEKQKINDITLITSASHMKRALVIFNEINKDIYNNRYRKMTHIAYMNEDQNKAEKVSKDEEIAIYRDLIRASGIWVFPGLQR
ncbi:ElyC/SanA/YdcF family protein [Scopulibacillus cellulosilyticus]|uniref:ElyC/SanA/YdcF family protein n=1 Tax=Scopulibacillus cellulosilyticus TaxID=2665665 RepID=A0ABW2Q3I2_9BACL